MRVLKHNYSNPFVSISIDEIDLSGPGIFLLEGENGSGKTSILENLFHSKKLMVDGTYETSISYLSQVDKRYSVLVYDYLASSDSVLRESLIQALNITYLHKNLTDISGGEYSKAKIARTFLKRAKLLVFDEPTNNLDDETVDVVAGLINGFAQHTTVIIVSHDPRLKLNVTKRLIIESRQLVLKDEAHLSEEIFIHNYEPSGKGTLLYERSYFKRIFFSAMNLITVIFMSVLVLGIASVSSSILLLNIPFNATIGNPDYMELIDFGSVCGEGYDDSYLTAGMTCVNGSYFDLKNIEDISNLPYVRKVYIHDEFYENSFSTNFDSENIDAMPNTLSESPFQKYAFSCSPGYLIAGRMPIDGGREFISSVGILEGVYGISGNYQNQLGKSIEVGGRSLELVGITQIDVTCISYKNQDLTSLILISKHSAPRLQSLKDMLVEITGTTQISQVFIEYDATHFNDLLNYVRDNGASYQVNSDQFFMMSRWNQYKETIVILGLGSVTVSIALGVLLNVFTKNAYILKKQEISDLSDLIFDYHREKRAMPLVLATDMFLTVIPTLLLLYSMYGNELLVIMISPFVILSYIVMYIVLRVTRSKN